MAKKSVDNFQVIDSRAIAQERLKLLRGYLKAEENCKDRSQKYVDDLNMSIGQLEKRLNG